MAISPDDIDAIAAALAPKLITQVQDRHHEFWIDPEKHYLDHKTFENLKDEFKGEDVYELKEIIRLFKATKSLWFKAFLGLAIVGGAIASGLAALFKWH